MILLVSAVALIVLTVFFTFLIRAGDLPAAESISPTQHLEERRAAIYENLRDLQFEYRVGKLSDADYQQTKLGLQNELAGVMAQMEAVTGTAPPRPVEPAQAVDALVCPHCGAQFSAPMRFCGQCGQEMTGKAMA
jgi:NADH pyrophosphatase NudC (nudix superfamily)